MDGGPQNSLQKNGKALFGLQNTGSIKLWSLQVALDEFSNVSSSQSGTFGHNATTVPGASLTRFNKAALEARARKRPSQTGQDAISPSMKNGDLPKDFGIIQYPSVERTLPREIKLQEWEGQVQEVGSRYFCARLVDLTAG